MTTCSGSCPSVMQLALAHPVQGVKWCRRVVRSSEPMSTTSDVRSVLPLVCRRWTVRAGFDAHATWVRVASRLHDRGAYDRQLHPEGGALHMAPAHAMRQRPDARERLSRRQRACIRTRLCGRHVPRACNPLACAIANCLPKASADASCMHAGLSGLHPSMVSRGQMRQPFAGSCDPQLTLSWPSSWVLLHLTACLLPQVRMVQRSLGHLCIPNTGH